MSFGEAPIVGQVFCTLLGLLHLAEEEVTLPYFSETIDHVAEDVVPRIPKGMHLIVSHPGQPSEVLDGVD